MQDVPGESADPAPAGGADTAAANDVHARSVHAWVAAWGAEVAAVDLAAGRRRFHPDAVAFGTHADLVHGLDNLHDHQWSAIWPNIEGFAFREDELVTLISPDALQAVAVVTWDSTGFTDDGHPFERPGRATLVLERADTRAEWRCTHTHFSLARDVPSRTYGRPTSEDGVRTGRPDGERPE